MWEPAGRLLRFLDSLTTPPADPAQLTVAHLEAFQRHRARAVGDVYAQHDLGEIIQLLKLCATLAAGVAAIPSPSSHLVRAGTGAFRRAESGITIEVA